MTCALCRAAEEWYGIKADADDIAKLKAYLLETYHAVNQDIINKIFSSGEAAGFLTVNETYFFREPAHFAFLKKMLPSFAQQGIRICSAATASGCEAYSIAMLIESCNAMLERPLLYHIDAFDINPQMIEKARKGFYSNRALREDGNCFRYMSDPYLKKLEDGYQADMGLQKNINFFTHNIMNPLPLKPYDIIFFRNAFIYFTPPARAVLLSRLAAALKPGGSLFLGVSETAGARHPDLEERCEGDVFYFKKINS